MTSRDRVTTMKRVLADMVFLLGATVVVFFALTVFILIFQPQNNVGLDRAFVARGYSFVAALVKLDGDAVACFGLFVGLAIVLMARLMCQLPRRQWELSVAVQRLRQARAQRPPLSGLDLPRISSLQNSHP
jgi:hypothetical protein